MGSMDTTTAASRPRTTSTPRRRAAAATLPPRPPRHARLARLLAPWLDPRLAAGATPESSRLLAARAEELTSPEGRGALADAWDQVLARAARPAELIDPRLPLALEDVRSASGEIAELAAALRRPSPVAAADVARARELLTDGGGPLYNAGSDLALRVALVVADLTAPR